MQQDQQYLWCTDVILKSELNFSTVDLKQETGSIVQK